jgi:hypothetical protein
VTIGYPHSATRLAHWGRVALWFDWREISVGWPQRIPGAVTVLCLFGLQLAVTRRPPPEPAACLPSPAGDDWAAQRKAAALDRHQQRHSGDTDPYPLQAGPRPEDGTGPDATRAALDGPVLAAAAPARRRAAPPNPPVWRPPRAPGILSVMTTGEDDGACPGPCNTYWRQDRQAYKKALAAYDPLDPHQSRPEPPQEQPVPPQVGSWWCGPCITRIRAELTRLDHLGSLLHWHADGHSTGLAAELGRVAGGEVDPLSPSTAGDELADLTRVLEGWEDAFRDLADLPAPDRRGNLALPIHHCVAFLGTNLDRILGTDLAADFGREVSQWYGSFLRRVKADPEGRRKPVRCPLPGGCDQLMLIHQPGTDRVTCQSCGRSLTLDEYEAIVGHAAAEAIREGRRPAA